jgi:hypothetical protein
MMGSHVDDCAEQELRDEVSAARAAYNAQTQRANDLLLAFTLREFQSEHAGEHLGKCLTAYVSELDPCNGAYGCDTGCEYLRLEAVISCECGSQAQEFTYGEFGDIAGLVGNLIRDADGAKGGGGS